MPEILTEKLIEKILYCLKAKKSIYDCDKCLLSGECGNGKVVQSLAQTALTLYEIIAKIEWIKVNLGEFGGEIEMCPLCRNEKQYGHYENCDFNLIKTMEG